MPADCAYMLLILLVPLLPAFLLFKFLPSSSSDVSGPFKGLNIKLGGAFAGYFITVVLAWQVFAYIVKPTMSDNWNVVAHIAFDGSQPAHPDAAQAVVLVKPPTADIDSTGFFQMMVPIPRVHTGAVDIQRLVIAMEGYQTVNVPLDPDGAHLGAFGGEDYQVTFDKTRHSILINKPIVLVKAQ